MTTPPPAIINTDVVETTPIAALTEHPENPRQGHLPAIRDSIAAHGFYGAIVAQRSTGRILAGNHRWLAAKAEGHETVPVCWVDVDDETALGILLGDNRTSDRATYDPDQLTATLTRLAATEGGIEGTGWAALAARDPRLPDEGGALPPEPSPAERAARGADAEPPPTYVNLVYEAPEHDRFRAAVKALGARWAVDGHAPGTSAIVIRAVREEAAGCEK